MNKKRIMFLVLIFLSLIGYTNIVSAGPSLCCERMDANIVFDIFLTLWPLFLILLTCTLILIIMKIINKKKERK